MKLTIGVMGSSGANIQMAFAPQRPQLQIGKEENACDEIVRGRNVPVMAL